MITINEFYEIFTQNIFFTADARNEMTPQSFFEVICETLVESGDLTLNYSPSPYQKLGLEVAGWDFDEDRKVLTLLVCKQFISNDIETLSKQTVDKKFKRLYNFYEKSINKFYENLEETSDAFTLAFSIYEKAINKDFNKVKLVLLTNGKLTKNVNAIESKELYGVKIEYQIIDIEYLYKTSLSNYIEEDIEIEVDIPCLKVDTSNKYSSFLAVINGETICDIYENLGKKVLDENVRTFLQFKGGVNKGIRNTIEYKPEYFFAYNNGITATAKSIELNEEENKIIKINNLHIVNGGQTTSSIYRSKLDLKKDVSNIFVQMKLSLVKENNDYQEFVQNISRFANTQNKVNESDLFSNHEFHKEFSKYSKKIWAPPKANQQKKTRWFYERVRGEYLNDLATCSTMSKKNNFKQESPKEQVIDKVFLAKSENVWNLKPVEVCKGAQYSFKTFAEEIVKEYDKNNEMITEIYFKNAIARVIIFKKLEKIISKSDWYDGGYRAQVVAYTLAYIANFLKVNDIFFNFNLIWESQDICDDLEKVLK
ncbi:MAG: AIPR family protein, partial [Cetobacterium sp.]